VLVVVVFLPRFAVRFAAPQTEAQKQKKRERERKMMLMMSEKKKKGGKREKEMTFVVSLWSVLCATKQTELVCRSVLLSIWNMHFGSGTTRCSLLSAMSAHLFLLFFSLSCLVFVFFVHILSIKSIRN